MYRVALCQLLVGKCKDTNIASAVRLVTQAAEKGAKLVVLPECFNSPYGTKYFSEYAEELVLAKSATMTAMAAIAKKHGVWVIAGSVPERENDKLFNTSLTFNPEGQVAGKYRKMHLFRINAETLKFDEGEVLTPGNTPTIIELGQELKAGIGICFDIRFPQLSMTYAAAGTSFLVFPGAFNMVTGPTHWELAARSRAVDAQQFALLCSPARDETADYVAWGHSLVADPWGNIIAQAGTGEELVLADLDLTQVATTRERLPIAKGTRNDLYDLHWFAQKSN